MTAKSRPRVLMIAYTNYESDPRVIREAEAAREGGFDVDVLVLRRAGQDAVQDVRGVRVVRLSQERYRGKSRIRYAASYLEFFLRCAFKSMMLHAGRRYRVAHVNNMPDLLVWALAPLKLLGTRLILDIHDPMPETFGAKFSGGGGSRVFRILLLAERVSVWLADRTITVSEPVKTGVLLTHGYTPETIGVVANFADDDLFRPLPQAPPGGPVRFVFHGTILERNGLGTLLTALRYVRCRDRIQVRIIGEGDFSGRLWQLIDEYGLGDVVEFRNQSFPLRDIPGLLADCHVGVVPLNLSTVGNYALPLKLVEYTCLGLPSISIHNAAIDHYLHPDECLFFEAGDPRALAGRIDEIASSPEVLQQYRDRLPAARQRLLWSQEKRKYVSMLRELCALEIRPFNPAEEAPK